MQHLKAQAFDILRKNDQGEYSIPSHGLYPVQFNWDSAFAAMGYLWLDKARAWRELELLTEAQWSNGMLPHIIFRGNHEGYFPSPEIWQTGRQPPTSGITQPPILATAVRHWLAHSETACPPSMVQVLQRIFAWHCWFMEHRLDEQTHAVCVVHPWESGRDNLVDWDAAMQRIPLVALEKYQRRDLEHVHAAQRPSQIDYNRYLSLIKFFVDLQWDQKKIGQRSPFLMVDPAMTAILLRAHRDLQWLLERYELKAEAQKTAGFIKILESGWRNLWNPKLQAVTAYDPIAQKPTEGISSASFLGPYAGMEEAPSTAATLDHFDRLQKQVQYLLPSYDPAHPNFDPKRYWRGPVWLIINRLVAKGLAEIGETARAERLRHDSLSLVQKSGFCEYYDPLSGEGLGGSDFTWTAAVFLDWVLELSGSQT